MTLINQPTNKPNRKVRFGGAAGLLFGVPFAQPVAKIALGTVNAISPDVYSALMKVPNFEGAVTGLVAVVVAIGTSYFVRDDV